MRIIGGIKRGKRLYTPRDREIRPTADRVRESIFNIISDRLGGAHVLDLFAGTGAMGLEALSRGAKRALFIDNTPAALALVDKNLTVCGWANRGQTLRWDIGRNLNCVRAWQPPFSLVFADPPYQSKLIPDMLRHLSTSRALVPGTPVIIEHARTDTIDPLPDCFVLDDERVYGKTLVSFFRFML